MRKRVINFNKKIIFDIYIYIYWKKKNKKI